MSLFFIIFFTVYTALNSYIFIRGWQVIGNYPILKIIYLLLFIIIAYGYVFAKLFYKILPPLLYDIWLGIGAIWFALLVYFILTLLLIDIIRYIDSKFLFLPEIFRSTDHNLKRYIAIGVIVVVSVIVFLGNLNKRNIEIRTLELNIPKGQSKFNELNIIMASDIHLSPIDGERLLKRIVDKMNSLNPDIILLAGDIVDDKAEILEQRGIGKSFRLLKPKYGVYSINGNHEFINGVESSVRFGESLGIIFLRDEYIMIDSSFYLIGREDSSMPQFTGKQRKSLEEIVENISDSYPKILLDHTPFKLEQAVNNNIDLQLSGHTHHGQIWPANLITNLIYEISWGYKKKGNTHFYVSSGAGTWGPPVRIGSRSEIVNLKIKFIDSSN